MLSLFIHALASVFAVMNPLGILPTFLALTSGYTKHQQRSIARRSVLYAFLILLVFLLLGNIILSIFSITIHAFRVAGGIVLFGIAYDLLHAKSSTIQNPEAVEQVERDDIAMTPLAIPIIAGPGTITSVMALSAGPHFMANSVMVLLAFSAVLIAAYLIFYYASAIHSRLSQTQLNVITRLMGFLLSIIAVQMAASGLAGLFPGLVHSLH